MNKKIGLSIVFVLLTLLLTSCGLFGPKVPPTPTAEPTPTELPMALKVNGEGILLEDYQAELQRFLDAQAKKGNSSTPEQAKQAVTGYLQNDLLLAQGAAEQGYFVDQAALEARFSALVEKVGGMDKVNAWMAANHFDLNSFKRVLARQMAAEWMEKKIADSAPTTGEQVHARQILFKNEGEAAAVKAQMDAGGDFKTLAFQYDKLTGGDLGWFPRGYLFQPDVENAAFSLQPGQISAVIKTSYGWHLVQVIERNEAYPLPAEFRLKLQHQLVEEWLAQRIASSTIEVIVP